MTRDLATAAVVVAFLAPTMACGPPPSAASRCHADVLDPVTAQKRLDWAWSCATTVNTRSPDPTTNPMFVFDAQNQASTPPGLELFDYYETTDSTGKGAFFGVGGSVGETGINDLYVQSLFKPGRITVTVDAHGFQKWTMPVALPHPKYPTYGSTVDIATGAQLFPNPDHTIGDCELYVDRAGTQVANTSNGFWANTFCSP